MFCRQGVKYLRKKPLKILFHNVHRILLVFLSNDLFRFVLFIFTQWLHKIVFTVLGKMTENVEFSIKMDSYLTCISAPQFILLRIDMKRANFCLVLKKEALSQLKFSLAKICEKIDALRFCKTTILLWWKTPLWNRLSKKVLYLYVKNKFWRFVI